LKILRAFCETLQHQNVGTEKYFFFPLITTVLSTKISASKYHMKILLRKLCLTYQQFQWNIIYILRQHVLSSPERSAFPVSTSCACG